MDHVVEPFRTNGNGSPTSAHSPRAGMTLVELLVVIAIIGLLIAMLLPAVQAARETARRGQCQNNLRQIGLAMHAFDEANRRLPSTESWIPDASVSGGKKFTGGSAFLQILPYLEQTALWSQYKPTQLISSVANAKVVQQKINTYCCPSMTFYSGVEPSPGWSSYAVCTGSNYGHFTNHLDPQYHNGAIVDPKPSTGIAERRRMTSIGDISGLDGATNTFLAGDLDYGLSNINGVTGSNAPEPGGTTRWGDAYPFSCQASVAGVFNSTRIVTPFLEWYTFRSDHPSGVNMLMVDGSVHFFRENMASDTLKNLARCDDANPVGEL